MVKWEWIYEMDVFEVVVVVEVDGRDNMELGMEDIENFLEYIGDLSHKVLSNLVSKIDFWVEMAKVSKEGVLARKQVSWARPRFGDWANKGVFCSLAPCPHFNPTPKSRESHLRHVTKT